VALRPHLSVSLPFSVASTLVVVTPVGGSFTISAACGRSLVPLGEISDVICPGGVRVRVRGGAGGWRTCRQSPLRRSCIRTRLATEIDIDGSITIYLKIYSAPARADLPSRWSVAWAEPGGIAGPRPLECGPQAVGPAPPLSRHCPGLKKPAMLPLSLGTQDSC
jgi:hypothetical protein